MRMSAVNIRTKTTVRHEYAIPSPACWTDVKDAMAFAARDRAEKGLRNDWDDVILVESDDENVIVYWEEKIKP
jgi:hypothetical protein